MPRSKAAPRCSYLVSALAKAFPTDAPICHSAVLCNHGQLSEHLARQIVMLIHSDHRLSCLLRSWGISQTETRHVWLDVVPAFFYSENNESHSLFQPTRPSLEPPRRWKGGGRQVFLFPVASIHFSFLKAKEETRQALQSAFLCQSSLLLSPLEQKSLSYRANCAKEHPPPHSIWSMLCPA